MNNNIYIFIMMLLVLFSSFSQVILKKSANIKHKSLISEYTSYKVVIAYTIFSLCIFANVYLLRYVELSTAAIVETLAYVYILVLCKIYFNERITFKKVFATLLIISGVVITII